MYDLSYDPLTGNPHTFTFTIVKSNVITVSFSTFTYTSSFSTSRHNTCPGAGRIYSPRKSTVPRQYTVVGLCINIFHTYNCSNFNLNDVY